MYKLLIDYGMPVMAEDITCAVHMLPNSKHGVMKLLVSKCEDSAYEKAIKAAIKNNKKQFIAILTKVHVNGFVMPWEIIL